MKALTWHGRRDVRVDDVPDPRIEQPTDALVRVTSTAICGSDLHLYELFGPFIDEGDILGHEPMGIVEEVGADVSHIRPGDRVVIPFNISCGHCYMCNEQLFAQCETTQVREYGTGASLFGYTKLYGQVPGGQARVLARSAGAVRTDQGAGGSARRAVPVPLRRAAHRMAGRRVRSGARRRLGCGVRTRSDRADGRAHRVATAASRCSASTSFPNGARWRSRNGIEVIDPDEPDDLAAALRDRTDGRGPNSVIDAVGMEAHGSPVATAAQKVVGLLPDRVAAPLMQKAGIDRLAVLYAAIDVVRRGGTISISGVYGGALDPMPMLQMFDKGVQVRMGQAHVKRWIDDIMPLVTDDEDPLGVQDLTTHRLPLAEAPDAYEMFQAKKDGAIKVVLKP